MMFNVGDIVKHKTTSGRKTDIICFAFVTYIQHNPPRPLSYVKFKGLNFNWHEDSMLTYREAQLWWDKVE